MLCKTLVKRIMMGSMVVCLVFAANSQAAWLNVTAKVSQIIQYSHTDTILVKLELAGTKIAACSNADHFAINGSLPESRRASLLSSLLAAQAAARPVAIAYDDLGGCVPWDSNPAVYRGITRLIL